MKTALTAKFDSEVFSAVYAKLAEQGIQLEEYRDNYFCGTITVKEDQAVFFSIPDEEGWRVFVDGEEAEKAKVFGAFLAVPVSEGTHTIELRFVSEGFYLGMLITVLSCIGFLLFSYLLNKRQKTISEENAQKASN